ncbi:MAG: ATP-binding protein [Mariprofundales bacterium]
MIDNLLIISLVILIGIVWLLQQQHIKHWQQKHRVINRKYKQQRQHMKHMKNMMQTLNEAVLQLDEKANVLSINRCAKQVFGIRKKLLPCSMQVLYRDHDWLQSLQYALDEISDMTLDFSPQQLPNIHLSDEHVIAVRLLRVDGQNILICLDISREYILEHQRERLVSNLMHDMKTPLTAILGYARALHDFGEKSDLRLEASNAIASETHRLNNLLESLLTLDKIACTTPKPIALLWLSCWNQVITSLEPLRIEKNISIQKQYRDAIVNTDEINDEKDIYLYINASSAESCLLNVLENAVHYSPVDSTIYVSIKILNKYVRVQIIDEGIGVPEIALPQLTERFFRLQQIATIKGHGLGLAIVQDTLHQYGGKLQLANSSNGGLKVSLYFAKVP